MQTDAFKANVRHQIQMLQDGMPMEAFDRFFASDGIMYANDKVFARGAKEARHKQEPFISTAKSISGLIEDVAISERLQVCVFRNRSTFTTSDDMVHQIDGLCWQQWHEGLVAQERYYEGDKMQGLIAAGILQNPEMGIT